MSTNDPITGLPPGVGGAGNPFGTPAQLKAAWLAEVQKDTDHTNTERLTQWTVACQNWLATAAQAIANGHTPAPAPAPPTKQIISDVDGSLSEIPWPGLVAPILPHPSGIPSGQLPAGFMGIGLVAGPTLRDVLDAIAALDAKVSALKGWSA